MTCKYFLPVICLWQIVLRQKNIVLRFQPTGLPGTAEDTQAKRKLSSSRPQPSLLSHTLVGIVGPTHECSPISFEPWMPFKTIFLPIPHQCPLPPTVCSLTADDSHLLQGTQTIKDRPHSFLFCPLGNTTCFCIQPPLPSTSLKTHNFFSPSSMLQTLQWHMPLPPSSETLFYQLLLFPLPFPLLWLLPFSLNLFQPKTRTFSGLHHSFSHLVSCISSTDRLIRRGYVLPHLLQFLRQWPPGCNGLFWGRFAATRDLRVASPGPFAPAFSRAIWLPALPRLAEPHSPGVARTSLVAHLLQCWHFLMSSTAYSLPLWYHLLPRLWFLNMCY